MRYMLVSTLLFLSGSLLADTKTEIETALEYFAEMWNEGDAEALRGYYSPDFVLITGDGPITLQERFEDIKTVMRDGQDRGLLETSEITVRELGAGHAMAYAFSSLTFKDGSSLSNWFTTVYEKTPFGWKAILTQDRKN